ncbi:MAG TPA: hypothetical protein VF736_21985 [Pyrinomonadaceae bacterium]
MNYPFSLRRRNTRALVASFIAYVMLAGQLMPAALAAAPRPAALRAPAREAAAPAPESRAEAPAAPAPAAAAAAPRPLAFALPGLTATKVDTLLNEVNGDTKADPGQQIEYTVTITNNGPTATNVTFTDNITDPNLTLDTVFGVKSQPIANPDPYSVIGNVGITPDATTGLLANDCDPDNGAVCLSTGLTVAAIGTDTSSPFDFTTAKGGRVTSSAVDGSFKYTPPPGYPTAGNNSDSFQYTVTDGDGKTDTATATLTIGGTIWFVKADADPGGNGTLDAPYNCYTGTDVPGPSPAGKTCFSNNTLDEPGDSIFLFSGNYTGGNALLNNQKLIGQGATDTLATVAGVSPAAYAAALMPKTKAEDNALTPPTITASAATAVPVAQGNVLRGFNVGDTTGGKKIAGSGFLTLTVGKTAAPDVALSGPGAALDLTNGTFAATSAFSSVATTSTGPTTAGVNLTTVHGTVAFGSTSVSGSTAEGIKVTGSDANINFGDTTVSGGTDAVSLSNNNGGTRTFGTLTVSGASAFGFHHFDPDGATVTQTGGGNTTVTGDATIGSATGGNSLDVQGVAAGTTVSFTSANGATVTKGSPGGAAVNFNSGGGTLSFSKLAVTASNGPGAVVAGSGLFKVDSGSLSAASGLGQQAPALSASSANLNVTLSTLTSTGSGGGGTGVSITNTSGTLTVNNGAGVATNVQNSAGAGISVTSSGAAISFGNTSVTGTAGTGVSLSSNGSTIAFADLDIQPASGATAFNAGGSAVTSSSGAISTTNAAAITTSSANLNMTLDGVSATISSGTIASAVALSGSAGTLNVNGGSVTGGNLAAFSVTGGSINVNYKGNISQSTANQPLVSIVGGHAAAGAGTGIITFDVGTLSAGGGTRHQFDNADGGYTFGGTTTLNGGDAGIDILNGSNGNFTFGTGVAIGNTASPSGTAFNLNGSNAAVTYSGSITKNNSGLAVDIDNHDANTVTFQTGTLSSTSTSTGLRVQNCGGGTVNFNNTTKTLNTGANPAVTLATNTGATINFGGGGLNIDTTTGTGFSATGGGTVNVTGTVNVIDSTDGTALNVVGTTIGPNGLTFEHINAGSGSNSTPAGIILDNTGNTAGLTVTGTGGTCTAINQGGCSGGTIQHKTGADIIAAVGGINGDGTANFSGTNGVGIFLRSTRNPSFTRMNLHDFSNFAIVGTSVSGFTLANSVVMGINGSNPDVDEASVRFDNLTADGVNTTANVTNSVIQGGIEDNFHLINTAGTLNRLNFTSVTFGPMDSGNTNGDNSLFLQARNTSTVKTTIQSSTFTSARGDMIQLDLTDTATGDFVFKGNTVNNTHPFIGQGGGGVTLSGGGAPAAAPTLTYDIGGPGAGEANTFRGAVGDALLVEFQNGHGTSTGKIRNNTFGVSGVAGSASVDASAVEIRTVGRAAQTVLIDSNQIFEYGGNGVLVQAGNISAGGTTGTVGDINATVTNNTVSTANDAGSTQNGIHANLGTNASPSPDTTFMCVNIQNNNAPNSSDDLSIVTPGTLNGNDYLVRQRQATTMRLPGYGGSTTDTAAVETYIKGRNVNGASSTVAVATPSGGGGYVGGAACVQPNNSPATFDPSASNAATGGTSAQSLKAGVNSTPSAAAADAPVPVVEQTEEAAPTFRKYVAPALVILNKQAEEPAKEDEADKEKEAGKDKAAPAQADAPPQQQQAAPAPAEAAPAAPAKPAGSGTAAPKPNAAKRQGGKVMRYSESDTSAPLGAAAAAPAPARLTAESGGPKVAAANSVVVNIGTLPAGDSVTITFRATVNNPFSGGSPTVTNQGTVTAAGGISALTDDTKVGANNGETDPTVTQVNVLSIRVNDAKASEPASNKTPMLFTVSLSAPAASAFSLTYQTADQAAGAGHAVGGTCGDPGVDYESVAPTLLNFAVGDVLKTITVNVCSDAASPETDETFLLNLSAPGAGTLIDGSAVGTITQGTTPGTLIISELRTSGPDPDGAGGSKTAARNEFVELYNNSDSPRAVAANSIGLFKMGATCNVAPVLVGVVGGGNPVNIPARGHYLFVGNGYGLADYGGTGAAAGDSPLAFDLEDDANVALFSTTDVSLISTDNRLDAVGFGANDAGLCALLMEGTTLPPAAGSQIEHSYFRKNCDYVQGAGCQVDGDPKDTNDNSADFLVASTDASAVGGVERLGAPGPENTGSPTRFDNKGVLIVPIDQSVANSASINRSRDLSAGSANFSQYGTLTFRRRIQNNTTAPLSRLRIRVVELTTAPQQPGNADLRALTSAQAVVTVSQVNDTDTCNQSGKPTPPQPKPCSVDVFRTTLEQPPAQPIGGGYNSTFSVTLGAPLPVGQSVNVQLEFGVQQPGKFRFFLIVEALNQ